MLRILRVCTVLAVTLMPFGMACRKNRPPAVPQLSGPNIGKPGSALTFTISTTDPENQEVAYRISWGDTSSVEWTSSYASGQQIARTHVYADSSIHYVKVKARDTQESESEWTDSLAISIGFMAPNQPVRPTGPSACTTGIAHQFSVMATHPMNDSVWVQFDWGESIGGWDGPVASDSALAVSHTFDSVGVFNVLARAKDAHDAVSAWSEPLPVTVYQGPGGPPLHVGASAATDSTVRLRWDRPGQGNPSRYIVSFRETGTTSFLDVGQTTSLEFEHIPHGKTGKYQVKAVFGGDEYPCDDTASTIPIHTATTRVWELDTPGLSGFGWDRSTGVGSLYPMSESSSAAHVDFYITNRQAGYTDPPYNIGSPFFSFMEPGNPVPAADWRTSGFSDPLPDEMAPLPSYTRFTYFPYGYIDPAPKNFGTHTSDNRFALIKVTGEYISDGYVDLETWYQPVQGLRLIQH